MTYKGPVKHYLTIEEKFDAGRNFKSNNAFENDSNFSYDDREPKSSPPKMAHFSVAAD